MYRVGQKMNFIIWNYLEDLIRVEKSKNLLKTYTHRCEASRREAVAISNPSSLRASQRAVLHPLSLRARLRRAWQSQDEIASLPLAMTVREIVIARLPFGKPRNLFSKVNLKSILKKDRDCHA